MDRGESEGEKGHRLKFSTPVAPVTETVTESSVCLVADVTVRNIDCHPRRNSIIFRDRRMPMKDLSTNGLQNNRVSTTKRLGNCRVSKGYYSFQK